MTEFLIHSIHPRSDIADYDNRLVDRFVRFRERTVCYIINDEFSCYEYETRLMRTLICPSPVSHHPSSPITIYVRIEQTVAWIPYLRSEGDVRQGWKKVLIDYRACLSRKRSPFRMSFLNALNSTPAIDETLFREEQRAITRTTAARFIAPVNFIIRIQMYGWTPINRGDLINLT